MERVSTFRVTVERTGRTFGIFVDGKLVEGGFFDKLIAEIASEAYRAQR